MKENKAVGPNFKTYFYYTNEMADDPNAKASIIIAHGMEGTGSVYDEIGDYLDKKGYALYAIDELGYGKTGKVTKKIYKNWNKNSFHFASYNIHALSVLAKAKHPQAPVYLIGNDFGAMLCLYLIREFPEVIDKVVTLGWGMPRGQDYGFLLTSWIKKFFLCDDNEAKGSHRSKNKRFALRFESREKYAWLTSDKEQLAKIKDAGNLDTAGTIGHYFYYYKRKIKTPLFMRMKDTDRETPMLFVSGDEDLLTMKGRTTKGLEKFYKSKHFANATSLILPGRHMLMFEKNRFENLDVILNWLEGSRVNVEATYNQTVAEEPKEEAIEIITDVNVIESNEEKEENVLDIKFEEPLDSLNEFQEAEDELLINTNKEDE